MPPDDIISTPHLVHGSNVLYPGYGITYNKPPVLRLEKFPEFADCHTREATFRREQNIIFFHDPACLADAGFYCCGNMFACLFNAYRVLKKFEDIAYPGITFLLPNLLP